MKLSTTQFATSVTFAVLMTVSSLTSAKINYVDGEVKNVNVERKIISIVEEDSGEVRNYRVDEKVSKRMKKLREGDSVSLKLESAKLEK